MTNGRCCRECGALLANLDKRAIFCSPSCRKAWNNRRMVRGAELYDLVMAWRFDRAAAQDQRAFQTLCGLASAYNDADKALRAGRKSYNLREALARLPLTYGREGDKR